MKEEVLGCFTDCVLGYEDFVDIFLGSSQNWDIFRGHFYALCTLGSFFLRSWYRMGDIFAKF